MLIIRKSQFRAFESENLARFEQQLLEHLEACFPADHALAGEEGARALVHHVVARTSAHGLVHKGEICRYLGLSLAFGSHLDRDPLFPWVARMLENPALPDAGERLDRLEHLALEYLDEVAGERGQYYSRAMLRVRGLTLEDLSCDAESLEPATRQLLGRLYPRMYQKAEGEPLDAFLLLAHQQVARFDLLGREGAMVLPALMFMLGSHVAEDPQYPWVARSLEGDASSGSRSAALLTRSMAHLERALAFAPQGGE